MECARRPRRSSRWSARLDPHPGEPAVLGKAANGPVFRAVATISVGAVGALAFAVVVLTVLGKS